MSHRALLSISIIATLIAGPFAHATHSLAVPTEAAAQPESRKPPYEVLEAPTESQPILDKLEGRSSLVWLDGEVLHIACISADGPMQVTGGVQRTLDRIPGSDIWIARLRWADWPKAFVSYAFVGPTIAGKVKFEVWRGEASPPPAPRAAEVARSETVEIESRFLNETRKITVILPRDATPSLPAVIMADGQGAETWGKIVQALVEMGLMRPIAIVGIHNAGYRGDRAAPYDPKLDYRGREYIESEDPDRFTAHLSWVTDEVLPLVADRFGISTQREDLAVAGFSNGAAFAASAAMHRPDVFGSVIVLSAGAPPTTDRPAGDLPRFRCAAGSLEPGFNIGTTKVCDTVKGWGGDAAMQTFVAGHDNNMWDLAFSKFAPELFPPRQSP